MGETSGSPSLPPSLPAHEPSEGTGLDGEEWHASRSHPDMRAEQPSCVPKPRSRVKCGDVRYIDLF